MKDFYEEIGKLALGSRLRRLSENILSEAKDIYSDYGIDLEPRWFPIFYLLSHEDSLAVTDIAARISHTHASVSQMIKEMKNRGLIVTEKDQFDGRKSMISLSAAGKDKIGQMNQLYPDVTRAVENLLVETTHDVWEAINELEYTLTRKNLQTRVKEVRKARESEKVKIVAYRPEHKPFFKSLNYQWINKHFEVEQADIKSLEHPDEDILQKGGRIFMATYGDTIVGTVAMKKLGADTFELAKMAVVEEARGRSIGWLLGKRVIDEAKALGASRVYIESNTKLKPAINLYHKLGFKKIKGPESPYARCNIQLELII
ncbi:bifunctional helix-turn-helix transcriptional regulator/GNAT family N-acetyltransferase [Fulvivirgaceae bacterium BMA12]|uniref:Bifunctional helix-turn-helix transcriptional regulator/GNAT family N-acetyltransferase n=1 Tax=Agaribacillus aureus TaxID=3051825 RepID=A0ABT8L5P6_9BACT|nr:bifunctional helix-turn-helix transcriptional regulator/GNAT family N-acetyltransferase [Fulvivirgaceae bacterium BMA12]